MVLILISNNHINKYLYDYIYLVNKKNSAGYYVLDFPVFKSINH